MSDEIKLLGLAHVLRKVARETGATAQQLSRLQHRELVLSSADLVNRQAETLEQLAVLDAPRSVLVSQRVFRPPTVGTTVAGLGDRNLSPISTAPTALKVEPSAVSSSTPQKNPPRTAGS
jgi:hypothetical protein